MRTDNCVQEAVVSASLPHSTARRHLRVDSAILFLCMAPEFSASLLTQSTWRESKNGTITRKPSGEICLRAESPSHQDQPRSAEKTEIDNWEIGDDVLGTLIVASNLEPAVASTPDSTVYTASNDPYNWHTHDVETAFALAPSARSEMPPTAFDTPAHIEDSIKNDWQQRCHHGGIAPGNGKATLHPQKMVICMSGMA